MKKFVWLLIVLFLVFANLFVLAEANTVIKIASINDPTHISVRTANKFKEIVEDASNKDITVEVIASGALGSEKETIEAISVGGLEAVIGGLTPIELYAPKYAFVNAPFVIRNWDHWLSVWNSDLGQEIRDITAKQGNIIYLGALYAGQRHFIANKPVYTPSDVQGFKLRLPNFPSWIKVWQEIGALPTPIAFPETYTSLKLGVADGLETDFIGVLSSHFYEIEEYISMTGHLIQSLVLTMNKDLFDSLSSEHQQLVTNSAEEACIWGTAELLSIEKDMMEELKDKGMKIVEAERELFFEAARPAIEELFKTEYTVTTWDEVLSY